MPTAKGEKFFLCPIPQPSVIADADWSKLDWTEIEKVYSSPSVGVTDEMVSQALLDTEVTSKAKSTTDAGDQTLVVEYRGSYTGQEAIEAAAKTDYIYAVARRLNDADNASQAPTVIYGRALIGGPVTAGGENSTFVNDAYALAYTGQRPYRRRAETGTAPTVETAAAIAGTAQVGEELSASAVFDSIDPARTVTYQWLAGGVEIDGATESSYTLTAGEQGDAITVTVTCESAFGSVSSTSSATAAVAAA